LSTHDLTQVPAPPGGADDGPIRHLYFFDDLSFHIQRIARERRAPDAWTGEVLRRVWSLLLDALACVDRGTVDPTLVSWDHACAQLSVALELGRQTFDLAITQGCAGEQVLAALNSRHLAEYGHVVAPPGPNVRLTHIFDDPGDPFYSSSTLGISRGEPVDRQCDAVAAAIVARYERERALVRVLLLDDCIYSGASTSYLADELIARVGAAVPYELSVAAFLAGERAARRFRARGMPTLCGVVLRGDMPPDGWESDVYFTKDQIVANALRFADGTSTGYFVGGWYDKVFPEDPERATRAFVRIREYLDEEGILAELEAM